MATPTMTELTTREVLELGTQILGVAGGMFFNSEGLVVESEWKEGPDPIASGAAMADVCTNAQKEMVRVQYGDVDTILIEAREYTFYVLRVPRGYFLFVALPEANLGTMRMKIEELRIRHK